MKKYSNTRSRSFSTVVQTATPTDTDLHIAFRYFFVFTSDPIAAYIPHAHNLVETE